MSSEVLTKLERLCYFFLVLSLSALLPMASASEEGFLHVDDAFQLSITQEGDQILLRWDIADSYYLYRHRLSIEGKPSSIVVSELPAGESINDEFFGDSQVYYESVEVRVDPQEAEELELSWQGCAKAGLCYPPQQRVVAVGDLMQNSSLPSSSLPSRASITDRDETAEPDATSAMAEDQRLAASLAAGNTLWILTAFFGMGLLLTFTPCVLPMVPILSSLIVGGGHHAGRGLLLSLAFVLPMALTYSLLGVAAALAGANLQILFQHPVFISVFAVLFVLLAMAMFGFFEMQLPAVVRHRLDRLQQRQQGGRMMGAAIMGTLSALLVGPCMTAPLAGALLYIAESGNALQGGTALLSLGLGMGTPLLLVGLVGPRLLPKPGLWMVRVKALFGFVLLGMAIWFAERILPAWVVVGLWGALAIILAMSLWQVAATTQPAATSLAARSSALIIGIWGAAWVLGAAGGSESLRQPLGFLQQSRLGGSTSETSLSFEEIDTLERLQAAIHQASAENRWTMVDFTADWCVSCDVIEEEVFQDPNVQQVLAGVTRLQPDVTENSAKDREIMQAFGILGPPTIMFFGPDGQERRANRVIGELSAEDFLENLESAGLTPSIKSAAEGQDA